MPSKDLPEGVSHYDTSSEVPRRIAKYFHQRHQLFSKYDEGIWMTEDAWFGVTPEPVARRIADDLAIIAAQDKVVLIDAFAGVGGNTIAFARSGRWKRVYAIEKDPASVRCLQHNAEIYGVAHKIMCFQGDVFEVLRSTSQLKALAPFTTIFASPPWGGPDYTTNGVFDLTTMEPYPLSDIHEAFSALVDSCVYYLPRTSNTKHLSEVVKEGETAAIEHYCMGGCGKALVLYTGAFDFSYFKWEGQGWENGGWE